MKTIIKNYQSTILVGITCLLSILLLIFIITGNINFSIMSITVVILLILLTGLLILNSIKETGDLQKINKVIQQGIDKGLAHIIEINFENIKSGTIGELSHHLNIMLHELKSVFWIIKENLLKTKINNATIENMKLIMISYIQQVSNIGDVKIELDIICKKINSATTSTKEILNLIIDLANRTNQEAIAIKHSSDAIEKLLNMISGITGIIQDKQQIAQALKAITDTGRERLEKTFQVIYQLNENTDEMLKIIQIIDDITDATNILSINAGIEAAHSGQTGSGFKVIANEIKKLVLSSKQNADEIAILLKEQVKNINLALNESTMSDHVFREIYKEVEETTKAWAQIARNATDMADNTRVIKESTAKMTEITQDVKKSSDTIKQSVETINTDTKNLEETSIHTLDMVERVTVANEEAKKSTQEILQQLNDMGKFIKELNKTIDFFNLGKKIFFYAPDTSKDIYVILHILYNEYEIYPVHDLKRLLKLLREFSNAILLVAANRITEKQPIIDFITVIGRNPNFRKIKIGILTTDPDISYLPEFKEPIYEPIILDKEKKAQNYLAALQFIKKNRAHGLRKNIRVECVQADQTSIQILYNQKPYHGNLINFSAAALLAHFPDDFKPTGKEKKLTGKLVIKNDELNLICISIIPKEANTYLINYKLDEESGNKEKLYYFIYQKLQLELNKSIP